MIKELKKQGWTFTYIGANHNVDQVAFSLSITNTLKFEANEKDVKRAFDDDKDSRIQFCKALRQDEDVQKDYFKKAKREKTD